MLTIKVETFVGLIKELSMWLFKWSSFILEKKVVHTQLEGSLLISVCNSFGRTAEGFTRRTGLAASKLISTDHDLIC